MAVCTKCGRNVCECKLIDNVCNNCRGQADVQVFIDEDGKITDKSNDVPSTT